MNERNTLPEFRAISRNYFKSKTARRVRREMGDDAPAVHCIAFWLMLNMERVGVVQFVAEDVLPILPSKFDVDDVERLIRFLDECDFVKWDPVSGWAWMVEGAKWQNGTFLGGTPPTWSENTTSNNKLSGSSFFHSLWNDVERIVCGGSFPFAREFFERYSGDLYLNVAAVRYKGIATVLQQASDTAQTQSQLGSYPVGTQSEHRSDSPSKGSQHITVHDSTEQNRTRRPRAPSPRSAPVASLPMREKDPEPIEEDAEEPPTLPLELEPPIERGPSNADISAIWEKSTGFKNKSKPLYARARALLASGYTVEDLALAAECCAKGPNSAWMLGANTKGKVYVRPETVWGDEKFPTYLAEAKQWKRTTAPPPRPPPRPVAPLPIPVHQASPEERAEYARILKAGKLLIEAKQREFMGLPPLEPAPEPTQDGAA